MAYYAFLDDKNIVTEITSGIDETKSIEGLEPAVWYGNFRGQRCIRTSYNGRIRFNYAGIGYTYDEARDAFMPPKNNCHDEEVLDEATCLWVCTNSEHDVIR